MFSDWNFDFDLESEDFACCADILVLCPHQVISLASERTQAPDMEFLIFLSILKLILSHNAMPSYVRYFVLTLFVCLQIFK